MPLYEYHCPNGHDFEKFFRSIGTASTETECPACGALGERRLSTTGLVFKGSGFYITDYGKDGKGPRKPPESETKADPGAKAEPKADAPAAPKPESKPAKPAPSRGEGKRAAGE